VPKKDLPQTIGKNQSRIRVHFVQYDLSHVPLPGGAGYSLIIGSNNNVVRIILILLFLICIALTAIMYANAVRRAREFADELAAPIMRVADHADRVAHGKLDVEPLPVEAEDEIGRLSSSFNVMVANLREMVDKDKSQRKYLETEVEQLTEKIAAAADGDFSVRF